MLCSHKPRRYLPGIAQWRQTYRRLIQPFGDRYLQLDAIRLGAGFKNIYRLQEYLVIQNIL